MTSYLPDYSLSALPLLSPITPSPAIANAIQSAEIGPLRAYDYSESTKTWVIGTLFGQVLIIPSAHPPSPLSPSPTPCISIQCIQDTAIILYQQGMIVIYDTRGMNTHRVIEIDGNRVDRVKGVDGDRGRLWAGIEIRDKGIYLLKGTYGLMKNSEKILNVVKEAKGSLLQIETLGENNYLFLCSDNVYVYRIDWNREQGELRGQMEIEPRGEYTPVICILPLINTNTRNKRLCSFLMTLGSTVRQYTLVQLEDDPAPLFTLISTLHTSYPLATLTLPSSSHFIGYSPSSGCLHVGCFQGNRLNEGRGEKVGVDMVRRVEGRDREDYSHGVILKAGKFGFLLKGDGVMRWKVLSPMQCVKRLLTEGQIPLGLSVLLRLITGDEDRLPGSEIPSNVEKVLFRIKKRSKLSCR